MEYVIGIDGGGTKTKLKAVGLDGSILAEITGGPSNIHSASVSNVSKILSQILDDALYAKELKKENCRYLCMGASGVEGAFEKKLLENQFRSFGIHCPVYIANDSEAMLAASVDTLAGIVVISGTGSTAYGRDKTGKEARSGGWGHIIGDEGSAYGIATRGITAAVRYSDGRAEKTILLETLSKKLGIKEYREIIKHIYGSDYGKSEIAALAVVVDEAYKAGDKVARDILLDASKELYLMFNAVATALAFDKDSFKVVAGGSVLEKNNFVYDNFCKHIYAKYKKADIIRPIQNAVEGAVKIALKMMSKI